MKFNDLSKQYRRHIVLKGLRKCPVCGGTPSIRSPKGLYCEKHVTIRAAAERRRIGWKKPLVPLTVWVAVDWSLGADLIAIMLKVKKQTVLKNYQKVLGRGLIKPVEGFCPPKRKRGRPPKVREE